MSLPIAPWLLAAAAPSLAAFVPKEPIVLDHVTVIDCTGAPAKPDQRVVIEGERIVALGRSSDVASPAGARVVDAKNKFVIPGLWDMHAHPDDPELWPLGPSNAEKAQWLPLFVANGVTGIRDMGGDLDLLQEWRARIDAGEILGPRIVACGPMLDGPKPMWPGSLALPDAASARAAVGDLKKRRADFLKVYSLMPRDAFIALADEAKKQGMRFEGHVPDALTPSEASDAGMASEEHMLGILRECADPDAFRERAAKIRDLSDRGERFLAQATALVECYREERARDLFARFVKNGTFHDPTFTVQHAHAFYEEEWPRAAARLKYVPPTFLAYWTPEKNVHLCDRSPKLVEGLRVMLRKNLEVAAAMHRAGVRLLNGTDMGANPLCFAGFSTHDELENLVNAGVPPMDALITATRNPAKFLGRLDALGTVEKGKLADLVLLDGDPLADIRNVKRISAVIVNGKLLARADLDRTLAAVEAAVKKS